MAERIPRTVSPDSDKIIRSFAKSRGLELTEATDKLLKIADSRVAALDNYALGREVKPRAKKTKKRG